VPQGKAETGSKRVTAAQRWVLALASVASFLVILDMLVVAIALTAIHRDLGSSLAGLEWTVNAYTLSFAVLLMTAAAIGDRLGRRRVFAAGLALFAVSSAACALAPDAAALIAARGVQGAGAAAIMPMALALLNGAFPPGRRGWAIGIYGSVTGLAAVLGPVLGGAVTQGLGWRWIFWINVPVALAAVPLVLTRLQEARGPASPGGRPGLAGRGIRVDLGGQVLVTAAALGLVWGLVRGNDAGWGSAETVGTLAAGTAAAIGFAAWQRRAKAPMLPPRLFASRAFCAGNATIFLLNGSLSAAVFLMPQFQQVVLGQHPLSAGLRLLPWGIPPLLLAPRAGALADRIGERLIVVAGLVLQAAGLAWIAAIASPGTGYPALITPMTITGVGFAIAIPAVTRAATSNTPPADIGRASGAYATMRQLGGAFGIAIAGAAFAAVGGYFSREAFSDGFTAACAVCAAMAMAGAATATALPGRGNRQAPPAPAPVAAASVARTDR
jgi:EmrB/QacA subfamily drug resistance transporter